MTRLGTVVFGALLLQAVFCCDLDDLSSGKTLSLEENTRRSEAVLRGTVFGASWDASSDLVARLELTTTYKGVATVLATGANVYKQLNVTLEPASGGNAPAGRCLPGQEFVPEDYILFATGDDEGGLHAAALVLWTAAREGRIWASLGWGVWSDWSSCSVSCSGGIQQRTRNCLKDSDCPGHNVEQRHCNLFSCYGTVDPLSVDERAYFHGPHDRWQRVPNRPTAWKLHPDSYIWLPSSQLFKKQTFPREFSLFITLRLGEQTRLGTIFSLRSRRRQQAYVSLELAGRRGVNLVHASANGTDIVRIPLDMDDGRWHQISISVSQDTTINSFADCEWLQTDILKSNSFDIPEDSDLIIGYLFEGDLEQMTILTDPSEVALQCSPHRIPITDSPITGEITRKSNS